MALTVTTYPHATVNGETSRWNAVHHPITYTIQRRDQAVQIRYHDGTNTIINTIGNVNVSAVVGTYIQYFTPNGQVYTLQILAVTTNDMTVSGSLTGTVVGGYVNYLGRSGYYIETEVLHINESNGTETLGRMKHVTDTIGNIEINVATWLKSKAIFPNSFEYDQINKAIFGEGGRYTLRFVEYYDGKGHISSDIFGVDFWTNSAKQVGDVHGSKMAEYVPTIDDARPNKAKFLTVFETLTYFEGFPFSLSFIYSDNIANYDITREEERFDLNGSSLSTSSDALIYSERWNVNRLMIAESYATTVKSLEVWLESGDVIDENQVEAVAGSYAVSGTFAVAANDINNIVVLNS
jgi:hypothetical protein